ncbi:MAG TPA: hypothetical protein PLJ82_02335 [Paludibacteraceae bacterium]|nr:hypothetical protein [Paludibacteraceae bacterium]
MKIIQTFWTKNFIINNNYKGGWLSDEANFMCWALSCLNAKKIYGNIELYTDTVGKKILIDKLNLPYDRVHLVFDNNDFMDSLPNELWAISKIYTYSLQNEPFIHVDGDFILWENLDFQKDITCQNLELNFDLYKDIYNALLKKMNQLSECEFIRCLKDDFLYKATNMGVFGGYNISHITQYANNVINFVKSNINNIDLILLDSIDVNCFLEQYYLYYFCEKENISINTIHPEMYDDQFLNKTAFYFFPSDKMSFNHFLGNNKKNELINDYVKRKLNELYPAYYNKAQKNISNTFEYYSFCKNNVNLNVANIKKVFINNLHKCNAKIQDDLLVDFESFWEFKYNLLNQNYSFVKKRQNTFDISNLCDESLIRLNDNFITINKYLFPWEDVFLSNKFTNEINEFNHISEKKKMYVYCIFFYTPFEGSIGTLWTTNLFAFILYKIINSDFQTISDLVTKLQSSLSKNSSESDNSYNKVKSFLLTFLEKINYYEIIDTKNDVNFSINNY